MIKLEKIQNVLKTAFPKTGTWYQYLWHIEGYLNYLDEVDEDEPNALIEDYIQLKTTGSKPWSKSMVNVCFYALKWYYEKTKKIPIEKRFFINPGVDTGHEPKILNREEVQTVWKAANELDDAEEIMIHVGWEAALRTGELVTLKGGNFKDNGILDVRVLKTKRARKNIELTPETFRRVLPLITSENRPVFRRPVKEGYIRRYTSLEWSWFFHDWTDKILGTPGIRWHDFARHTRLTHLAEDTKSFYAVLQLSGHQNPAVCRQYFERAKIKVPELDIIGKQDWKW